jgi:hypothetical protein
MLKVKLILIKSNNLLQEVQLFQLFEKVWRFLVRTLNHQQYQTKKKQEINPAKYLKVCYKLH